MKKVSVVAISHNAEKSVEKVLASLSMQDYENFEVIIVDDNSKDGTIEVINTFLNKQFRLIRNETNLGLAKSMNRGIRESNGEIIITLHDDCVPLSNDWITKLVGTFDQDPKVGIATSDFVIDFKNLSIADKLFSFAYFLGDDKGITKKTGIEDIPTISDKADAYKRDVLFKVSLFDESFRIGGEDMDLSKKVKALGYRIVRNNACKVEHIFNQSHREDSILNHFRKAFKSTEDAVYVLLRYGMWYKFDSFLVILLWMLGLITNQFYIAFAIGLSYLLVKNFLKSLRYYYRYKKYDLIIPIWMFCTVWDILAGFGWIAGLMKFSLGWRGRVRET